MVPSLSQLVDWVGGRLPPQEAAEVAEAVAGGDEALRRAVEWAQDVVAASADAVQVTPPPAVSTALRALFARPHDAPRPSIGARLAALLVFDSGTSPLAVGLRAAAADPLPRQLVYRVAEVDVVVDVERAGPGRVRVGGQVLEPPIARAALALRREGDEVAAAVTDEHGEFSLGEVAEAAYELVVRLDAGLATTPLDLRSDGADGDGTDGGGC